MVRQALRYQVLDSSGVPIAGASIQVAQVGTTTNITQTMYAGLTGVTTIANPLITDASGRVQAYFDGEDAVALLRVTMIPTLTGFTFTSRDVQLGSDYGVLDAGDVPIKGLTVDAKDRFNMARTDAGDPATLQTGDMWYNTTTNALHWQSDVGTQTVSSTTGDVTDVVAGDGLSGVESPAGVITIDVVAGNAINVDATDVEVDVNAATSAAAALAGDDKILISDTDDANTTKSATISQIDPTMLDGTANQVYFSNSTGNVTGLTLGAAGTVLTSAGATSDPTFGTAATVGANKSLYTNNSDVESGVAFGAAGTVLTSGGTDATATPPTWEAAAAGGVYTANSTAAITNGHIAVLDAAGTLSPVGSAAAAGPPSTVAMSGGLGGNQPSAQNNSFWDEDSSTLFTLATSSNTIQLIPSTVSWTGGTPTMTQGSLISTGLTTWFYNGGMGMYDKYNNKVVIAGRSYGTGTVLMQTGTVSGSGTAATISWDTVTAVTGYAPSYLYLTYMRSGPAYAAGATVALLCNNNSSGYREGIFFDVSGSAPVTMNTYNDGTGGGTVGGQPVCDGSGNLKFAYVHASFASARWGTFYYGSGNMGAVALPAATTFGAWIDMAWDETNNRGVIAVTNIYSPSGSVYVWEVNDGGGGTGSVVGTDANWGGVYTGYMNTYNTSTCFFDEFSGTCLIWWATTVGNHTWTPVTLTGSGVSVGTATATTSGDWVRSTQSYGASIHHAYASGANLNFASGVFSGSSTAGSRNSYAISNAYLSTNEEAWLGVAKNTTTGGGQAQEVYVIGGVATEGLSGLTIGSNYYVQSSGQVSTVNTGGDRLVGKAIAADKILVENTGTGTS